MSRETLVLGGGCFWCVEAVFRQMRGVISAVSGYAGGATPDPDYDAVCGGDTGHAEVVAVTFDPAVLPRRDVLRIFFSAHDPTTPNRQGADVGPQYRSLILVADAAQRRDAEAVIAELETEGVFPAPIVTEIAALERFHPGEAYHQDYYARNARQPYCQAVIAPKLAKVRAKFATRLA